MNLTTAVYLLDHPDRSRFVTGCSIGSAANGFVGYETNSMQIITGTLPIFEESCLYLSNYYIIIRRSNLYGREGYLTWTFQLALMRSFCLNLWEL